LHRQFIIPPIGAAFGVTNRQIELRRRIAGFGLANEIFIWPNGRRSCPGG
jgi:hypothetical protein